MARHAVIRTTPEGQAHNCFWLTGRGGTKLRDDTAVMLADRVRDYVAYCTAPPLARDATEWRAGDVRVSNAQHPKYTVVTVLETEPKPGFLLEIASVLSAYNIHIQEGVIQAADKDEEDGKGETEGKKGARAGKAASPDAKPSALSAATAATSKWKRVHRFWATDSQGKKLTREHIQGLLFTLNLALGSKGQPLKPPDNQLLWSFAADEHAEQADPPRPARHGRARTDDDFVEAHDAFDAASEP
ncbi:hypothetical protein H632_c1471p0 [Helicosporidium sp. ATCC 50920]|nr:hypothetical protein H632_c1471p0 [Helicosporidium sp. ATCC 50920]|eukprot:KDD74231.1 hypothetical protein H632_c1471p0 [Helicosporidium sp. ATCC 50920]